MLKLFDSIELKTAMLMYKANKKMLPLNIQQLFSVDEVTYYNTRQLTNMKQVYQNNIKVNIIYQIDYLLVIYCDKAV